MTYPSHSNYQQDYQGDQNPYYPPQYDQHYPPQAQEPKKKKPIWKWALGILAALVLLFIVAIACSPSEQNSSSSPEKSPGAAQEASPNGPEGEPQVPETDPNAGLEIGQTFTTKDNLAITVTEFAPHTEEFLGEFSCATINLVNNGDKEAKFSGFWDWKVQNPAGVIADMDSTLGEGDLESGSLAPGGQITGKVCTKSVEAGSYQLIYDPMLSFSSETAKWNAIR